MGRYSIFATGLLPQFHLWAKQKFGSLVRLWRCLDVHNHMRIGQGQFLRGLQDLGFAGDAKGLFKDLNRDQTGTLLFYHFAPEAALAVGEFLYWVRENYGSLENLGITDVVDKRNHITRSQLVQLCKKKGFHKAGALDLTFDLLDKDGDGSVVKTELALLEQWDFPEWLTARPDAKAAETCKQKLIDRCQGNALLAWRNLDRSGSMRVAWHDFRLACRKLLSSDDCQTLASAWRSLDDDLSGWLSLREFDKATYDQLTKFVSWIDATFGGMLGAFPKLGIGGTRSLPQISLAEWRHVCKASGLGDSTTVKIFQGLDIDCGGYVTMNEIRFLNSWKVLNELKEEEAWASLTNKSSIKSPRKSLFTRSSIKQAHPIQVH